MKSYICANCDGTIWVGHPTSLFRRQAKTLARETTSWITRLFRRATLVRRYFKAFEEKYYLELGRYRTLPHSCPSCGFRGGDDLPWWRPGIQYSS